MLVLARMMKVAEVQFEAEAEAEASVGDREKRYDMMVTGRNIHKECEFFFVYTGVSLDEHVHD